jgi:uncharacterized membrane protein YfhO
MKNNIFPYLIIFVLWFVFASPYFLKGLVPFPSNYQVNNFSPASSYPELAGPVKNGAQPDIITQIYPWKSLAIKEWKSGEVPLWNPYSFSGTPLLSNYQSAVFSPLNILFFLPLKFVDVWSLLVLLQPLLAGIFIYLFMRSLKSSSGAGLLSAFSFMFCGFITTWMGYATLGYAILFIPLGLFSIEKYFQTQKRVFLFLLSFTSATSLFSGHFQTSLYLLLLITAFTLFRGLSSKEYRKTVIAILHIFFGVLIAMPQILPTIELYSRSVRSALFQKGEVIPWSYLPSLFAPDFFGNPVTRNDWFGHYAEWNGYAGVISLILASLLLFVKKTKVMLFFFFVALISLLLAFDTPLVSILIALRVPVLSTSAASRIIVLFSFSLAVLAGFGFDELFKVALNKPKKVYVWFFGVLTVLTSVTGFVYFKVLPSDKSIIARNNIILPFIILFVFAFLVLILTIFKNKKITLIFSALILLVAAFDMYRFASKWQAFDPKDLVFKNVKVTEFYNSQNHIDRAVGLAGGEDGVYYEFPALTGYDPLYDAQYGRFISYVAAGKYLEPERSVVNFPLRGTYTSKALNFLGVKYIVHKVSDGTFSWAFPFELYPMEQFTKVFDDNRIQVFENRKAYPRAYVVNDYKILSNEKDILRLMFEKDTNLLQTVFLQEKPDIAELNVANNSNVSFVSYKYNSIALEVNTSNSGILILTDDYYPGWQVTVNGKHQKILRADYSFRGVVVPKGKSIVKFSYLPQSFLIGIYLSLLGGLGIIMGIVMGAFKIKK